MEETMGLYNRLTEGDLVVIRSSASVTKKFRERLSVLDANTLLSGEHKRKLRGVLNYILNNYSKLLKIL
jgi:hypothetical protein